MLSTNVGRTRMLVGWRRLIALPIVAIVSIAGLTVQHAAMAAPAAPRLPAPPADPTVKLGAPRPTPKVAPAKPYAKFDPDARAALPKAQQAMVALPAAAKADGRETAPPPVRAGTTPISVSRARDGVAPQQVRVATANQKTSRAAGIRGVLFSLSPTLGSGEVGVVVDPSTFRSAFGGDYAARLRLVQLPVCALTTPQLARCRTQTPLHTSPSAPLSAQVKLAAQGMTVLAATSNADGSAGDYTATALSPAGTWSVGGNTGAFTYSYPIAVPPSVGGAAPKVSFDYDSTTQDARTAGTNNQSSWIGDGWNSTENYIERSYQSCKDVDDSGAPVGSGDVCWSGQILTLSLNGQSTVIVYDDATKTFRAAEDNSTTTVENLTGAENGTKNGEYFRVTQDGMQYYFGLNRLPGWSGQKTTDSVWTVPVYQAHGGVTDCPDGAFAETACTLGYRFNLDYVVDLNGNAMAYYYQPETGFYGANAKDTAVKYTRGGFLRRIDYGMTKSTVYSGTAPAQVVFSTDERCIKGAPAGNNCDDDQFTETHPEYWPDTPVDLNCVKDATDCQIHGPSFWSRQRLVSITTQIQADGATKAVDRYDLTQTFPDGGDHAPTLWLESIKRTGLSRLGEANANTEMPAVTFNLEQLPNRVRSDLPRMYHNRIKNVTTEFGAQTTVDYEKAPCSGLPASDPEDQEDTKAQQFASTNTTGCQPVYWTPEGQPRPLIDWFYTYRVKRVATIDQHNRYQDGSAVNLVTQYSYPGAPAWHYDDNEVVKKRYRTWGQFRGYGEVDLTTGDPTTFHKTDNAKTFDQQTLTKTFYFRGMNGDTLPGGRTRTVDPLTSQDGTVTTGDHASYSGREFETVTYSDASGDTIDNATITVPTVIGPTASRTRKGLPALTAQIVRTAKSLTRKKVSYGWRRTETDTFYNTTLKQSTTGMPVQVADRGEVGAAANKPTCTFTRYLDGTTDTLVVPAEKITTDQDCPSAGASPSGALISHERTSYDGNPFAINGPGSPARPTRGNPTLAQQASTASGAIGSTFVDMAESTYDDYGRVKSTSRTPRSTAPVSGLSTATYSIAQTTYTRYTPTTGALPKQVDTIGQVTPGTDCSTATTSSKDCHLSSVVMEQSRQLPVIKVDAAGQKTSLTYDALGRLTAVWLPNKNKTAGAEANLRYTYKIAVDSPNVITTQTLLERPANAASPAYATSKVLHDALLRPLETQAEGENGTTTVSNTQYDSLGQTVITNNAYAVAAPPSDTLFSDRISQVDMPSSTVTDHDAMGRPTQVTQEHNFQATWFTRTAYTGDTTTDIPPSGSVATTKTTNGRDQLTRLQQYTTLPTVGGNRTTGFTINGGTSQDITYQYDAAGRQTVTTGPPGDNGATGTRWEDKYDLLGRKTTHIDPDTGTSISRYDDAGDVTATRDSRGNWLDYTYDLLGRKLTATDRGQEFKYAAWTYDTLRIGQPTASTRWVKGVTGGYITAVTGYSILGKPLGQRITLPSTETPLPLQYETSFTYTPNTELLSTQLEPTVGRLSGETIDYSYTRLGAPTSAIGAQNYITATIYTNFGLPSMVTMGAGNLTAAVGYTYDDHTLRMTTRTVSRTQGIGPVVDKTTYTYDPSGNPLSATNEQSETGNTVTDSQCYRYNTLVRLTQAWTSTGACPSPETAQPPQGTVASGAGSYWQSFSYDAVGNRTQLVDHSTTGGADTTTAYGHGCQINCDLTGAQPDTLTSTTGGSQAGTFRYNAAGQLLQRTPTNANTPGQNLTWNSEDRLAEVATTGATPTNTTYLYDADGNQLIRRDPGRTTLFAGATQVVVDTATKTILGASRTIIHAGAAAAIRSTLPDSGNHYLLNDPHGSASLAMETTTQAISRQQFKPYGEPRSTANPAIWPDPARGYLGAPKSDTTGYTDLGARKYDPALGRFISPDPLLDTTDPNQLAGYTYAGNNPITLSDPNGLRAKDPDLDDSTGKPTNESLGKPPTKKRNPPGHSQSHSSSSTQGSTAVGDHHVAQEREAKKQLFLQIVNQDNPACRGPGFEGTCASMRDAVMHGYSPDQAYIDIVCSGGWAENWCRNKYGYNWNCGNIRCPELMVHSTEMLGVVSGGMEAGLTGGLRNGAKAALKACSFSGDTKVLMADGTTKPIAEIKPGEKVYASDPETGTHGNRTVLASWPHDDDLMSLDLTSGTVTTTEDHPFWNTTDQRWERADALDTGDQLTAPIGSITIKGLRPETAHRFPAYSLTVEDIHTYYVLAGNAPVLVHNCGELIAGPSLGALRVSAANPSASELAAAQHMAARGSKVVLRDPVGPRGTATSDLLVDGVQWDVYTPTTGNVSRIVSSVASKGSQVQGGGVVVDLSRTSVSADQLANIQARIAGTGARVGQIEVIP
ncbi:RHS repeat-associated core domain-containing protein [Actinoplanes sp. NPDC049265]|uniref:RHS repeat-associated core domain-containing protein n=1 Tax=Actinoplanes sp. NPDC049265 TaxID=3363902 RepID=UPI0037197FB0